MISHHLPKGIEKHFFEGFWSIRKALVFSIEGEEELKQIVAERQTKKLSDYFRNFASALTNQVNSHIISLEFQLEKKWQMNNQMNRDLDELSA
jgi:hypothetical protein